MEPLVFETYYEKEDQSEIATVKSNLVPKKPRRWKSRIIRNCLYCFLIVSPSAILLLLYAEAPSFQPIRWVLVGALSSVLLLMLLLVIVIHRVLHKSADRNTKPIENSKTSIVTVDNFGIHIVKNDELVEVHAAWAAFSLVKETPNFYAVSDRARLVFAFKKAYVGDKLPQLEQYLNEKLISRGVQVYRYLPDKPQEEE